MPQQEEKKKIVSLQRYTVVFFGIALLFAIAAGLLQQRNQRVTEYYTGLLQEKDVSLTSHLSLAEQLQQQIDTLKNELLTQREQLERLQREAAASAARAASTDLLLQAEALLQQGEGESAAELLEQIDEAALSPQGREFLARLRGAMDN